MKGVCLAFSGYEAGDILARLKILDVNLPALWPSPVDPQYNGLIPLPQTKVCVCVCIHTPQKGSGAYKDIEALRETWYSSKKVNKMRSHGHSEVGEVGRSWLWGDLWVTEKKFASYSTYNGKPLKGVNRDLTRSNLLAQKDTLTGRGKWIHRGTRKTQKDVWEATLDLEVGNGDHLDQTGSNEGRQKRMDRWWDEGGGWGREEWSLTQLFDLRQM